MNDYALGLALDLGSSPFRAPGAFLLGLVFLWSGLAKIHRPDVTGNAIANFLDREYTPASAGLTLGLLEVLIGLGALGILPGGRLPYILSASILSTTFVALILRALRAGRSFDCGCFGQSQEPLGRLTLVRACAIVLLSLALALGGHLRSVPAPHVSGVIAVAIMAVGSLAVAARRLGHLNDGFILQLVLEEEGRTRSSPEGNVAGSGIPNDGA